jgi:hypothetical protein
MKFWFFTQCVNHTIILDDIGWEWDGNIIEYKSWLGNEHISESTGGKIMASTKTTIGISVALWGEESQEREEENSAVKTGDKTQWGKSPTTGPSGATEKPKTPDGAGDGTDDIWGNDEV